MDGTKILSKIVENLHLLDSLNFLPVNLKSMPKSYDRTCNMILKDTTPVQVHDLKKIKRKHDGVVVSEPFRG